MIFIAILLALSLSGCASTAFLKVDNDGYYRFENQPIEVMLPPPLTGKISAVKTKNTIDFIFRTSQEKFSGIYAVEIVPRRAGHVTKESFRKFNLEKGMKIYMADDRSLSGYRFDLLKSQAIEINGRAAVRAIGIDRKAKQHAVLIATSILFEKRIVIGSLLVPLGNTHPDQLKDFSKWPDYNSWVATIADITTTAKNVTSGHTKQYTSEQLRERALHAPAIDLAVSYNGVNTFIDTALPLAEAGGTVFSSTGKITKDNVSRVKSEMQSKLSIYGDAINKRGYKRIAGAYHTTDTLTCARIPSMWAAGIQQGILKDAHISQKGFKVKLVYPVQRKGKTANLQIQGIVVESSLAFSDPGNSDFGYIGTIKSKEISVRPDVNRVLAFWPTWVKSPSREDLSECMITLHPIQKEE